MSYLEIPRLGGRIDFGQSEAGSLTVPYDFHNGNLAANTSSAELSVPPNFSNLTMVIKRPEDSYGSIVVLESRASSTGPWSPVFSLDCNTSDDLNKTYLYPANVFQTRGPTMRVWRRKKINKPAVQWHGRWGGNYNGWGLVGTEINPANARFNPWRGQYGGATDWGDGDSGTIISLPTFTMTTTGGATVSKSFPSTVKPQFGVHYAWNTRPTKPGDLPAATYGFVSAKGNWDGSATDNTDGSYGPRAGVGKQTSATVHSVAVVACRNTSDGYDTWIVSNEPGSGQDYQYMTYKGESSGMEDYCSEIDAPRQFRVRNPGNSVINVHFFAAKYTAPVGNSKSFFRDVTVNPWGRLEIPMAADFRVSRYMIVQPSTWYTHYTNNTQSTQYCPSGLVSDYEGDRRTYDAPTTPPTGTINGGGGGGHATRGANSGAAQGGAARIAGPQNIPVTLVDPQTVRTATDAKALGFVTGQGLEKNVSTTPAGSMAQLDPETYIEFISGTEMLLNKPHVQTGDLRVNAFHYDLDRLYSVPSGRSTTWADLLTYEHLGSPGGDGGSLDTYPGKGGSGGGAIRMIVRYMNLSGRIWAIGASGAQGRATHNGDRGYLDWSRSDGGGGGGGGSGGTIWLIAENLSGGYGTSLQGLAPGLSPMCLMDQAYWNFPDLHGEEAGDGSLPIIMNLSSGPFYLSGNISVNGGDGGQGGLRGNARPVWRPERWENGTAFSATPGIAYAEDPGSSGTTPFSGIGISSTTNALGTEKRFTPDFFYYYKLTGFDVLKSYGSHTERGTQNAQTGDWSTKEVSHVSAIELTPKISLVKSPVFPNTSANETTEGIVSALEWAAVTPAVGPAQMLLNKIASETIAPIHYTNSSGGDSATAEVIPTYNPVVGGISYSLTSLQTLNGLTTHATPWLEFLNKAWVGNAYQLKANVQKEAEWGEWDGNYNGQNGGAGSAGRVRVDIGRLDGFNYQGITVTRKAGALNADPTPKVAASWDAGETGRTPRDGTIYPSPDLVKWYDPTHNFVYPGNGPLWEV
jgi:hypothetical protein